MSLENMGESQEIDRLIFTNCVKGCLTDRDHDLFRELDDNPASIIAEKMLFLAAFAPHPASFAPSIFTEMVNLTPDQANRILAIACALGFIFPKEGTSRWCLKVDAKVRLSSLCDP